MLAAKSESKLRHYKNRPQSLMKSNKQVERNCVQPFETHFSFLAKEGEINVTVLLTF